MPTIRFTRIEDNDEEVEFEVTGSVSPIVYGRFSGPPEDCYPTEGGEVLIESVYRNGSLMSDRDLADAWPFSDDETNVITDSLILLAEDDDYCGPEDGEDY